MKRSIHTKVITLGLMVLFLYVVSPGKPGDRLHIKVAVQLLEFLNRQLPGSHFKTDLAKCTVEPVGKNRYRVIFRNSFFSTDLAWIVKAINKSFPIKMEATSGLDTARIDEMQIIYGPGGPGEQYLGPLCIKGMKMSRDTPAHLQKIGKGESSAFNGFKVTGYFASIEKLTFDDMENIEKSAIWDYQHIISNLLNPMFDSSGSALKNLKLGMTGVTRGKDTISFALEIAEFGSIKEGLEDPDIRNYMFSPGAPPPDLSKTLEKGMAVTDIKINVGRIKVSLEKNGCLWGSGAVENAFYSLFIKPDNTGKSFKLGYSFGIKNLQLSFPGNKNIQILGDLKESRFLFSLELIPPGAIMALIDMVKIAIQGRDTIDNSASHQIGFQGMKFILEAANSEPLARFSISPFKHYFGELSAQADIRLHGLLGRPDVKISLNLCSIEKILKKMRESRVFSPSILMGIAGVINMYMVKKENGDASMTIEVKSDQPGKMLLNGILIPIPK